MKLKRMAVIFIAGTMLFSGIAGCGEKDTVKQQEIEKGENKQASKETDKPDKETESKKEKEDKESENQVKDNKENKTSNEAFAVTTEVYEDGDIHIEYPQVENLVNEDITDWYNEQFKSTVLTYTEGDIEEGDVAQNSESVYESFKVTYQSEDMISILIEGYYEAEGVAHPYSYMSSYNIDLKTGESMSITDQYTPEEIVDTLFSGENYTGISDVDNMEEMPEEEKQYLAEELAARDREFTLESMKKCDYDFSLDADGNMKKGEDDVYMHSIRLKDGKWGICLDVDHALGDYVIVRYDK